MSQFDQFRAEWKKCVCTWRERIKPDKISDWILAKKNTRKMLKYTKLFNKKIPCWGGLVDYAQIFYSLLRKNTSQLITLPYWKPTAVAPCISLTSKSLFFSMASFISSSIRFSLNIISSSTLSWLKPGNLTTFTVHWVWYLLK